jgi:hypothetical protein
LIGGTSSAADRSTIFSCLLLCRLLAKRWAAWQIAGEYTGTYGASSLDLQQAVPMVVTARIAIIVAELG